MVLYRSFALAACAFAALRSSHAIPTLQRCRNIPGDPGWPSPKEWNQLNSTIGGKLIATVPLGSPCHDPQYNATTCSFLRARWDLAAIQ